jgi:hypothetical protein
MTHEKNLRDQHAAALVAHTDRITDGHTAAAILHSLPLTTTGPDRPKVVCLCGSTRFWGELAEANLRETAAGRIVLAPGCDMKKPHPLWADPQRAEELKQQLDALHRWKIRASDEVLVVNVNVRLSSPSPRSPRAVPPVLRSASTALCHPQG